MNSNNRSSMFPFRRGGGKKRGKPQGGQGGNGRRQGSGGGRRIPNSAAELLSTLQPTTKNLAQVLAGNTKASGQVVHARNILHQAERLVDEQAVDRLPPKQREDFLEQLARLKLTLADADVEADKDDDAEPAPVEGPGMSMDRLRELALSLATGGPASKDVPPGDAASSDQGTTTLATPAEPTAGEAASTGSAANEGDSEAESGAKEATKPARAKRTGTLRLKTVRQDDADDAADRRPEAVR